MSSLLLTIWVSALGVAGLVLGVAVARGWLVAGRWLRVWLSGFLILSCAALLALEDVPVGAGLVWSRTVGPARLIPGGPGLLLSLQVIALLATTLWPHGGEGRWLANWSWLSGAMVLSALTVAALTSDHFLVRLFLLDLVSLGVMLLLLRQASAERRDAALARWYVLLRLGDMALLLLVLMLWQASGAWQIEAMLQAGSGLAAGLRRLVVGAGLVSVAVKMGLPPFQDWLGAALSLGGTRREWLGAGGLPLLGAYLLYRLRPLVLATGAAPLVSVCGALGLGLALWLGIRAWRQGRPSMVWWLAAHGALVWLLTGGPLVYLLLFSFIPLRWALLRWTPEAFVVAGEESVGEGGPGWLSGVPGLFQGAIEEGILRRAVWGCAASAQGAGRALQSLHTGRLRVNLRWSVLALLGLVALTLTWLAG